MKYLMNVYTGTIDTEENWRATYESMDLCEWFGFECKKDLEEALDDDCVWDAQLIEVVKDDFGWIEKKTNNRRAFAQ